MGLLVAVTSPPASSALAQASAPAQSFQPIGPYLFQFDGTLSQSAKIYHSPAEGAILLRAPELSSPLILMPRSLTFQRVEGGIKDNSDGSVEIAAGARRVAAGSFQLVANLPVFRVEGKEARFLLKPPLLGPQTAAAMKAHSPEYIRRGAAYTPFDEHMSRLRAMAATQLEKPVKVRIYFASWCHVCSELVPKILRIAEEIEGDVFTFEYYGLPRPVTEDPVAQRLEIEELPTGIIFVGEEEVGRVEGHGWRFPEMALSNTLR